MRRSDFDGRGAELDERRRSGGFGVEIFFGVGVEFGRAAGTAEAIGFARVRGGGFGFSGVDGHAADGIFGEGGGHGVLLRSKPKGRPPRASRPCA